MPLEIAPLFSGSAGNSTWVSGEGVSILIDAGKPCRDIERELEKIGEDAGALSAILITHEHKDHIAGVGPLSRKYGIPVYANADTWYAMSDKIGEIKSSFIRQIDTSDFYIGPLCVQPFDVPHDAARTFSFTVECGASKISIMTDQGIFTKKALNFASGSDIVLLESNHDVEMLRRGHYSAWLKKRILSKHGHLSNDAAAAAALALAKNGVRGILLAHISQNNNDRGLALETVKSYLINNGVTPGTHIAIGLAEYGHTTGKFCLE